MEQTPVWPRAVLAAGALGSLAMMFYAGRQQPSWILMALFTIWVASPFAGLAAAEARARQWSAKSARDLRGAIVVVAVGSLAVYGVNAVRPFSPRAATIFLIVPAATWLLSAIATAVAAVRSRS